MPRDEKLRFGPVVGTQRDFDAGLKKWGASSRKKQADPTPFKVFKLSRSGKRIGTRPIREFATEQDAREWVTEQTAEGFKLEIEGPMTAKISESRLRQIIKEEIAAKRRKLAEDATGPDHKLTAQIVSAASKLLAALEGFDKSTSAMPAVTDAVSTNVAALRKSLAHMIEAPTSYAKLPTEPKVVRLRAQKEETL